VHEVLANNLFFSSALIVSLVVYLRSGRPKARRLMTFFVGLVLAVALPGPAAAYVQVMLVLCYWSLACIALELTLPFFQKLRNRDGSLLARMAFAPAASLVTVLLLSWSIRLTPVTLDLYFYAFDSSLGFQPAFLSAQLLLRNDWLRLAAEMAYVNLPLGLAWVYFRQQSRSGELAARTLALYLAIGAAGYACYFIVPAVGPATLFGKEFPFHAPGLDSLKIGPVPVPVPIPRNCMPSLHASWALAILWSAKSMTGWSRLAIRAFAALTVLYACAAGGHYLIDLVVALPFTLAMYALTRGTLALRQRACQAALAGGMLLFVAWLVALRWSYVLFFQSRVTPWVAILLTCGVALALRRNLDRVADVPRCATLGFIRGRDLSKS
jgi:hypothetical protein